MLPQILALTIKGGPEGGTVDIGPWPFIIGSLPFIVVIVFIVMLTWYFLNKKRLEHQQIMAAIEKGTPLSELGPLEKKGSNWIINLSAGIGLSLMGLGLIVVVLSVTKCQLNDDAGVGLFIALIFLTVGIARLIRGILQRKAEKSLNAEKSALNANQGD
ncbi:MAG: hypothetical protein A2Y10_14135 [Planctomycetes bacterium GWF2_41_51]|nr:MAG: hypothetical protein A2Y10_14135 [Planctomycetes bacterium GWF2_41_51]